MTTPPKTINANTKEPAWSGYSLQIKSKKTLSVDKQFSLPTYAPRQRSVDQSNLASDTNYRTLQNPETMDELLQLQPGQIDIRHLSMEAFQKYIQRLSIYHHILIFPIVCLYALTLYPATADCAAATDISGVSGRWQLSR